MHFMRLESSDNSAERLPVVKRVHSSLLVFLHFPEHATFHCLLTLAFSSNDLRELSYHTSSQCFTRQQAAKKETNTLAGKTCIGLHHSLVSCCAI